MKTSRYSGLGGLILMMTSEVENAAFRRFANPQIGCHRPVLGKNMPSCGYLPAAIAASRASS